jgi:hypothetical protein
MELHRRLANDPYTEEPRLRIFATCQNTVKQMAGIPLSKTNSEDVDTKAEDHAYDALRYMVMTRMSGYASIHQQLGAIKNQVHKVQDEVFGY